MGVSSALLAGVLFVTSSSYPGADCKDTGLSREVKVVDMLSVKSEFCLLITDWLV